MNKAESEILNVSHQPGWQLTLWRVLIAAAFLVTGVIIEKLSLTSSAGPDYGQYGVIPGLCLLIAVVIACYRIVINGTREFFSDKPGAKLDQLVAIAVIAAIIAGEYTTAALVALIMEIGHLAEERGIRTAGAVMENLVKLTARTAHKIINGTETDIQSDQLAAGDKIAVYPGEVIPADGIITSGFTSVDLSHLTGESNHVEADKGTEVFHGTVNITGRIEVDVTRVSNETSLGQVIESLREAEKTRLPIARIIEQAARLFLPLILLIAAVTFIITRDPMRAITILVVACPFALVLSSIAVIIPALALAVRKGILVKGGVFLERAGRASTVIFDKTGTVTFGKPSVDRYIPLPPYTESDITRAAQIAASGSSHPVSKAVSSHVPEPEGLNLTEYPGMGVEVSCNGSTYRLGKREWVGEANGIPMEIESVLGGYQGTTSWIGIDGDLAGVVLLHDAMRPDAPEAIDALHALGVGRTVLLTGDRQGPADVLADQIHFDRVESNCLPDSKNTIVEEERKLARGSSSSRNMILFIGDGVNDALALNNADIGIAMGAMGNEVALESADAALMRNELMLLPFLVHLSDNVRKIININLTVSIVVALVLIVFAILGFISPVTGAILHFSSELFVIFNGLRILGIKENYTASVKTPDTPEPAYP